jgi:hypothetical protein
MIAHVTKLDHRTVQFVLDQASGRTHVPNAFEFAWPGKVDSEKREELIRELLSNQTVATIRQYDLFAELASAIGREEQDVRNPFPPPLLEAYRQNKLAILFGSGLTSTKKAGGPFPTWREIPDRLLDQAHQQGVMGQPEVDLRRAVFAHGHGSLEAMLADLDPVKVKLRAARKYQIALEAIFCPNNAASGDVHRALVDLGVSVLVTTNYDQLLEHTEGSPRGVYTWQEADSALSRIKGGHKVLFKIHGTADREKTVVMTRQEYYEAARNDSYKEIMRHLLQSYTFLLVGYGINDPCDLDMAFSFNLSAFGSAANAHYALMKDATQTDVDRWQRELNVKVMPYEEHTHLPDILRALRAHKP